MILQSRTLHRTEIVVPRISFFLPIGHPKLVETSCLREKADGRGDGYETGARQDKIDLPGDCQ
jgi:hypothetical protein